MIDQQVFLTGITLMSNHYDRKLAPSVLGIWKEYLDKALTTEEFQQAVKMTILSSRFFPTAKELVEAIKGDEGGTMNLLKFVRPFNKILATYRYPPLDGLTNLSRFGVGV